MKSPELNVRWPKFSTFNSTETFSTQPFLTLWDQLRSHPPEENNSACGRAFDLSKKGFPWVPHSAALAFQTCRHGSFSCVALCDRDLESKGGGPLSVTGGLQNSPCGKERGCWLKFSAGKIIQNSWQRRLNKKLNIHRVVWRVAYTAQQPETSNNNPCLSCWPPIKTFSFFCPQFP